MAIHTVDTTGQQTSAHQWTGHANPVWVDVRPNLRRIHVLAGDILAALGKRRDIGGKGRNENEDVHLAIAWMTAHRVADLVVVNAQRLDPRILLSLTKLAERSGTDLWLLHRPPVSDTTQRAINRRSDTTAALASVPVPTPHAAPEHPQTASLPVPHHDFHMFIAAVQRTLTPSDASTVIKRYHATATHTAGHLATSTDAIAAVQHELTALLRDAPEDWQLITDVRAVQCAAWNHDLHVSVDLQRMLNSEERPRTPARRAGPALLSYRQPYRAITWMLAAHHIGLDEIAAVPIDATSHDGATIQIGPTHIEVDPSLHPAVRAQRVQRQSSNAAGDDPLLPYATKTLSYALTAAARDLGLASHGRLAERQTLTPAPWLKKLGVNVRPLP